MLSLPFPSKQLSARTYSLRWEKHVGEKERKERRRKMLLFAVVIISKSSSFYYSHIFPINTSSSLDLAFFLFFASSILPAPSIQYNCERASPMTGVVALSSCTETVTKRMGFYKHRKHPRYHPRFFEMPFSRTPSSFPTVKLFLGKWCLHLTRSNLCYWHISRTDLSPLFHSK